MIASLIPENGAEIFVLLDSHADDATSRFYQNCVKVYTCSHADDLATLEKWLKVDFQAGLHAVFLASYEFGRNLHFADARAFRHADDFGLQVLLFSQCEMQNAQQVDAWLNAHEQCAGMVNMHKSIDEAHYQAMIQQIQQALQAGETYQINLTYRLLFQTFGSPIVLYSILRQQQPVAFGALIALPDQKWILSFSPELFFEKKQQRILTRPMKGTVERDIDPIQDQDNAQFLQYDAKNRAENLMIVDLLRNDLSKLAQPHSVRVPHLFSIEAYPTVWQMTSQIQADLPKQMTWVELFKALFPCGSITGAPKHRAMQLIDQWEDQPRGIYTGAIGWLDNEQDEENLCISVAIRTLLLSAEDEKGIRQGTFGVGGGIVLDSTAADEWQETMVKSRFLLQAEPPFHLFETMRVEREQGILLRNAHLSRLKMSADKWAFQFDQVQIEQCLKQNLSRLLAENPLHSRWRMKLSLDKQGRITLQSAPIETTLPSVVPIFLASDFGYTLVDLPWLLRGHKTTYRAVYDRAWRHAQSLGGFDMLFFNEQGELTEGGRSNVLIRKAQQWFTPPLTCGVLPGIMRAQILAKYPIQERCLTIEDVLQAEQIQVCNALNGCLDAQLVRERSVQPLIAQ